MEIRTGTDIVASIIAAGMFLYKSKVNCFWIYFLSYDIL